MRVKDMCLKNNNFSIWIFVCIFFFIKAVFADEKEINNIINYLGDLKLFSSSFIQDDGESISEGEIFIGLKRVRVEYKTPSKILIILEKDKAMYYNYDLDEDEFFNPKDTAAWFFFDIFNNPEIFYESTLIKEKNYIVIKKEENNEIGEYNLKVYFENNPLLIRKIALNYQDTQLVLSIFNHTYNKEYDKNFFKLINPTFFD